ncbi:hypothetical protein YB2330_000082 [Saitoella coloradoensis]
MSEPPHKKNKTMVQPKENVCLICIDGWGISPVKGTKGDAIEAAETPVMDAMQVDTPYVELSAHGLAVGLPDGLMGNSEVGHLNIGAGRVVWQDLVRIDQTIKNEKLNEVENLNKALENAKNGNGRLHFLGLVSDGGVHSHQKHLYSLLKYAKDFGVPECYIHFFGDGRDTAPKSAAGYMEQLLEKTKELGYGKLATVVGRYYAMDRDKRWERVQVAFDGLTQGKGEAAEESDAVNKINERYEQKETDEFLKPIIFNGDDARVKDNDTLFFFNYRSDRMRELSQVFGVAPAPIDSRIPENLHITTMTQYKADFPFPVAFTPQRMDDVLAETLAKRGVKQCHIAETEKYAHVTFFFNGGTEREFDQEVRDMVPSPKVATYDKKPEMSVHGVAEQVAKRVSEGEFPFIVCNLANPDMVGHTGVYDAAVEAVTHTDKAIGAIYEACKKHNYILFVTSDHGNAEKMLSEEGTPFTAHTTAKVPFVMTSERHQFNKEKIGALCDVAPTILDVMGLEQPSDMTGVSLLA